MKHNFCPTVTVLMGSHYLRFTCFFLSVSLFTIVVNGEDSGTLTNWIADDKTLASLAKPFSDARISFRPLPKYEGFQTKFDPELAKAGVAQYCWTPGGQRPSLENITVMLTPFAKPSTDALDKTISGMRSSIQKNHPDCEFGEIRKGLFCGFEARAGSYTATISGDKVVAFFLVSIDTKGTFMASAMTPESKVTPEAEKLMKTSLLTFMRKD